MIIKENNGKIHINMELEYTTEKSTHKMQGSAVCVRNYRCRGQPLSLSLTLSITYTFCLSHKIISQTHAFNLFRAKQKKINRAFQVIISFHATEIRMS